MIVGLSEVKQHLRVIHDEEDEILQTYIMAAEDYCKVFLGYDPQTLEEIPGAIKAGILIHVAIMYEGREGELEKNMKAVQMLYWPHRSVKV